MKFKKLKANGKSLEEEINNKLSDIYLADLSIKLLSNENNKAMTHLTNNSNDLNILAKVNLRHVFLIVFNLNGKKNKSQF